MCRCLALLAVYRSDLYLVVGGRQRRPPTTRYCRHKRSLRQAARDVLGRPPPAAGPTHPAPHPALAPDGVLIGSSVRSRAGSDQARSASSVGTRSTMGTRRWVIVSRSRIVTC